MKRDLADLVLPPVALGILCWGVWRLSENAGIVAVGVCLLLLWAAWIHGGTDG